MRRPWRLTMLVAAVVVLELLLVAIASSGERAEPRAGSAAPAPVVAAVASGD